MSLISAILLAASAQAAPTIRENASSITLSAGKSRLVFNKKNNTVKSLRLGGTEYVHGGFGLQPNYWRAMTEHDIAFRIPERSGKWKEYSLQPTCFSAETATEEDGSVTLTLEYLPATQVRYRLHEDGRLEVSMVLEPTTPRFEAPVILDGPGMVYNPDQTEAEREAQIESFRAFQRSVRLQAELEWLETAALLPRVGLRMHLPAQFACEERDGHLVISNGKGRGCILEQQPELRYTALRRSIEDLDQGLDAERPYVELCLDAPQPEVSGAGPYNLPSELTGFGFTLTPLP